MCNFLVLLHSSRLILLTCVASSAVVVSGENVCHLRSDLNECWAFHPGFHHLSFGQCQILHSEWSFTHTYARTTHTHTKDRGGWEEEDKKMRDSRRRVKWWENMLPRSTCCCAEHTSILLYVPWQTKHASTMPSSDKLQCLTCFLITQSQIHLIQVLSMPTNNAKYAATGNTVCGKCDVAKKQNKVGSDYPAKGLKTPPN